MLPVYLVYFKKWLSVGKKILFVLVIYSIVIGLFARFIFQDKKQLSNNSYQKSRAHFYEVINDPQLNKTPQGKLNIALYKAVMCGMIGEGCTNNPDDWDKNYPRSFVGSLTNLIVLPYINPPASGVYWVYEKFQNAGFIPKAYAAQGIGLASLQPLSKIWVALRDLAYMVLVLVMITIGFMIMFRMKLNPQTVITIENSLPKIVVALILITFSLPIAGFLIDLMYVVIALAISVLGQQIPATNISQLQQKYMAAGPLQIYTSLTGDKPLHLLILWDLPNAILNLFPMIGDTVKYLGFILGWFFLGDYVDKFFEKIITFITSFIPEKIKLNAVLLDVQFGLSKLIDKILDLITKPWRVIIAIIIGANVLIPLFIGVLILLTIVFIVFRIFFTILNGYLKILLLIVVSPIYLLFEVFPGQSAFVNWVKSIVSELLVFPLVIIMILFSTIIVQNASNGDLIQFPFLFGAQGKEFGIILGMFFLFMTPDIVTAMQQFLVPKPGPLEQAAGIGVFFGGATTSITGGLGELQKYTSIGVYIKPIRNLLAKLPGGKSIFNFEQHGPQE